MANSTSGLVWTCDTGSAIITRKPVRIKQIILFPNAAGDSAVFNYWDPSTTIAAGCDSLQGESETGTITSTTTLTISAGTFLPSTITDGSVFEITWSTGASANIGGPHLVTTAGNNTVVDGAGAGEPGVDLQGRGVGGILDRGRRSRCAGGQQDDEAEEKEAVGGEYVHVSPLSGCG